jgi:hypothetical protein
MFQIKKDWRDLDSDESKSREYWIRSEVRAKPSSVLSARPNRPHNGDVYRFCSPVKRPGYFALSLD